MVDFLTHSFYVNGRLFWGTDRMFFVERALGMRGVAPERLTTPPSSGGAAKLSFYFDYSSPWAYVGFMRLGSLVESVAPVQVRDDEIKFWPCSKFANCSIILMVCISTTTKIAFFIMVCSLF